MLDILHYSPAASDADNSQLAGCAAEIKNKQGEHKNVKNQYKTEKLRKTQKHDLRLMLVPTTFMFWVSFLPVPE